MRNGCLIRLLNLLSIADRIVMASLTWLARSYASVDRFVISAPREHGIGV